MHLSLTAQESCSDRFSRNIVRGMLEHIAGLAVPSTRFVRCDSIGRAVTVVTRAAQFSSLM